MKIKAFQLEILDNIFTDLLKKDLDFNLSFRVADFVQEQLVGKIKTFQNERIKTCEKFCLRDENNNPIMKNQEYDIDDKINFGKQMNDLFNTDIEMTFIPFKKDDFKNIKIKPEYIISLRELKFLI